MSTASSPVEIGRVALTVRDIDRVAAFYETAIGLTPIASEGGVRTLGAGGRVLLELRADRAAKAAAPREAGLFHTAFLLPSRADLGAWLLHASGAGRPLQGASDHLVSEAMYLDDPEGNGIELYRDRPREEWRTGEGGELEMATLPIDLDGVLAEPHAGDDGMPAGTVLGHCPLYTSPSPRDRTRPRMPSSA